MTATATTQSRRAARGPPRLAQFAQRQVLLSQWLSKLSQPALIVGGTTDVLDPEVIERSPQAFEGPCDVLIVQGAGHWPHREAPDAFEERLLAFLRAAAA